MDEDMPLKVTHDVSQTLQRKLEGLADVERALGPQVSNPVLASLTAVPNTRACRFGFGIGNRRNRLDIQKRRPHRMRNPSDDHRRRERAGRVAAGLGPSLSRNAHSKAQRTLQ